MGDAGSMSVAAQDTLTGAGVQTVTGAKTFNDQKLLLRNPAGTFSLTQRSPAITVDRNTITSLIPYHWDTLVWKDTVNSRVFAFSKDGTIISSGVAGQGVDDVVIQAAITATPTGGTLHIMPGSYIVGYTTGGVGVSFFQMDADIIIMAYGVTILSSAIAHSILFRISTGVSFSIYGATIDGNKTIGAIITGSVALSHIPKLIRVVDCYLFNFTTQGISNGGVISLGINDTTFDIRNTTINVDTVTGNVHSSDECIFTNAAKFVHIENCKLYNWKPFYLTGQNIYMTNVLATAEGHTPIGQTMPINAEHAHIEQLHMIDCGLSLRSSGSGDMQYRYAPGRRLYINGLTNTQVAGTNYKWLSIQPFNSTDVIEHVELRNLNCKQGPIFVFPHALTAPGQPGASKSIVKNLIIDGWYIDTMDTNSNLIYVEGEDIGNLIIRNVRSPAYAGGAAPIRLYANQNDITVNYASVENIYPLPAGYILRVLQDTTASPPSRAISITFAEPLLQNMKLINSSGSPAPTVSLKFYKNSGKFLANGNASTTAFSIPHSLVSSPLASSIRITPGHADSRGMFDVSADATNITVTYPSAPPTGTNNVVLYWAAEAG
jgi:hypothetical protein